MSGLGHAVALGVLQGLTEFLPISSSGHLVLAEHLLPGWEPPGVLFDVLLHVGTLGSVLVYYRRAVAELLGGVVRREREAWRYVGLLVLGSIPTAAIGLTFEEPFEALFGKPFAVGVALLVTAILLLLGRAVLTRARRERIGPVDALLVGTAQGLAIVPGISRSGSTVVTALLRGVSPEAAARYSFLVSVPAIAGAALLKALDGGHLPALPVVLAGVVAAFLSGWAAIATFVAALARGRFLPFAFYCAALGLWAILHFAPG